MHDWVVPYGTAETMFIVPRALKGLVDTDVELLQLAAMGSLGRRSATVHICAPRDLEGANILTFNTEENAAVFVTSLIQVLQNKGLVLNL